MAKVRMSSWNSIYRGVEINCEDAHIIVSSIRRFLQPINELMRKNGGHELNRKGTIWLHGKYGSPDMLGSVQGRIFSLRFGICCWNWWWIERDYILIRTVD